MAETKETYTTADKVRRLLRYQNAFSSSTQPTQQQVEALIESRMTQIDQETGMSFRLAQFREYKDELADFWKYGGARVPLTHFGIVTPLSAAAGDSLLVFDGSSWSEWVGVKTESRTGDFWIDEIEGVLHIILRGQPTPYKVIDFKYRYNNGARALLNDSDGINTTDTAITYDNASGIFPLQGWIRMESEEIRYNNLSSTVITGVERGAFNTTAASHANDIVIYHCPADIMEACTMLVAIDLLTSEDWSSGGTTSGDIPGAQLNVSGKIEAWQKKADQIIDRYRRKSWSVR